MFALAGAALREGAVDCGLHRGVRRMPTNSDFGEAVAHARRVGVPALLALDFPAARRARLKALAKVLMERKKELYAISAHASATLRVDELDRHRGQRRHPVRVRQHGLQ